MSTIRSNILPVWKKAVISFMTGFSVFVVLAYRSGPPPGRSGAPGEQTCWAGGCHQTGSGAFFPNSMAIGLAFPGAQQYQPGVPVELTLMINDPQAATYGFELSVRDSANNQAGNLESIDATTMVVSSSGVQYLMHTQPRTDGTFRFRWTPPGTDIGPVTFYVAANAANNDFSRNGDRIHTASFVVNPAAVQQPRPTILEGKVFNGASLTVEAGVAPKTYATIFTSPDLTDRTVVWSDFFVNGRAPKELNEIKVHVGDEDAYIVAVVNLDPQGYDQVNFLIDGSVPMGPGVQVTVSNKNGTSNPAIVEIRQRAPALFPFEPQGRRYVASIQNDGSAFVGPEDLFGGADLGRPIRPAKPGDIIQLFGTGFGDTNPNVPAGQIFSVDPNNPVLATIAGNVAITIGGQPATVHYAGLAPGFVNLYQFTITVPNLPPGDHEVIVEVDGIRAPSLFLRVGNPAPMSGNQAGGGNPGQGDTGY